MTLAKRRFFGSIEAHNSESSTISIGVSRPTRARHAKALSADLRGYWRYRVDDYRIICQIIEAEITVRVIHVGNRREVYRRR